MGLVRHRVSQREFAERWGLSMEELTKMLHDEGELSAEVRSAYALLEVEGGERGEYLGRCFCWAGKEVRNPNLLVVCFDDGRTGMVRKKEWFKPKRGVVMEVEPSDEVGFWRLVGDYRPNGVRLDV